VVPSRNRLLFTENKLFSVRLPPLKAAAKYTLGKSHLLVLLAATTLVVLSYWDVLPGIFQDEYVYSMEARKIPLGDQSYPTYLFSWLFEATNLCGPGFYSCGKVINSILLAVFASIFYLIARSIYSQQMSTLFTAVAVVSPATIFASFFMPEMLFFSLNLLAIWALIKVTKTGKSRYWIIFSLALGLALLTKRHELFLLPGYLLAAFSLLRTREVSLFGSAVRALVFAMAIPILGKQVIGFLLTGQPWGPLLGTTYGNSFRESTQGNEANSEAPTILELLSQGIWHLVFHGAILLILGFALVRWVRPKITESETVPDRKLSPAGNLGLILISLCLAIIPVVTFFESYLTLVGDNHSFRLLGRYYEFIYPLIMLAVSPRALRATKANGERNRLILLISGFLIFVFLIGPFIETGLSDSPTIHGLKLLGPFLLLFLAVAVSALFINSTSRKSSFLAGALVLLFPTLLLASGVVARVDLRNSIGTEYSYFDLAGKYFAETLPDVPGNQIRVIGSSRAEVVATKFAIDKPFIKHSIQPGQPEKLSRNRLSETRFVVVLFPTTLITRAPSELIHSGEGFKIYEIQAPQN
jgi:phosphoglycerol transferase